MSIVANVLRTGLLASLAALMSANVARADDWPSRGLGANNQRATAEQIGTAFQGARWAFRLPTTTATVASPAVADGYVIFGAFDGVVRAVGEVDGKLRWEVKLGDGIYATPVIDRGRVFVPSLDRHLHVLSIHDGHTLWTKDLGGLAMGSPVIHQGALIVAAGFPQRSLWKIDAATGETLWQTSPEILAQFSNSSAAIAGDQVIIGANEGHYYSFDLKTGALRWSYEAEGIVNLSAPVVVGDRAYILPGGRTHKLHAVDLGTGQAVAGWPVELPASAADVEGVVLGREHAVSSLAAIDGRLIFDFRIDDSFDSDANGEADRYLMRESVVAIDAATGKLLWQQSNGRRESSDGNLVPKFWLCPTPAVWKTSAEGKALLAVASTLTSTLRVLDVATGDEVSRVTTAGAAQISPIVANGRLFVGAHGVVEGVLSSVNQPPAPPVLAELRAEEVTKEAVTVRWAEAADRDGDAITYQVRFDRDGEILQSWASEVVTEAGIGGVTVNGPFEVGANVQYAVRARDAAGAWSDWSTIGRFAVGDALVTVPDPVGPAPMPMPQPIPQPDALQAIENARSGDVVTLGAGTFHLSRTLRVPGGVTVRGAGPGRTILQADGLAVAVTLEGQVGAGAGKHQSQLSRLTVTGATVGVAVRTSETALLTNVILRDNVQAGVEVHAGASAQLINGTLLRTGNAVTSHGTILVKNTIVAQSRVAFWSNAPTAITSRFNNVWENELDYRSVEPGLGDMGVEVSWVNGKAGDLHLLPEQASTDRGDPADDFSEEPLPNGGRINLGAYGGTDEAEPSPGTAGEGASDPIASDAGGCAVSGRRGTRDGGSNLGWLVLVGGVLLHARRRRR